MHHPAAFVLMAVAAVAVSALAWRADLGGLSLLLCCFTVGAGLGRVFAQRARALLAGLLLLFGYVMVNMITAPTNPPPTLRETWDQFWGSVVVILLFREQNLHDDMQALRWEIAGACVLGLALAVAGILAGHRLRPPRIARGSVPEPVGTAP